jgi:predicted dehydrogenase
LIRWGVLGTARTARKRLLPAILRSGQSIAAIAGRDPLRLSDFQNEFGIASVYSWQAADRLLEHPSVEAIYIPLPNSMHAEWTIRALQAGKHVLCEKPLTLTVAEADRVIAAATASNCLVMENFSYYLAPAYRYLAQLRSDLRSIFLSHAFQANEEHRLRYDPALGGGSFLDLGCYGVDLVHRLFDSEIKTDHVHATPPAPERRAWGLVDEKSGLAGKTASGVVILVHSSFSGLGPTVPTSQAATLYFADPFHSGGQVWHIHQIFRADPKTPANFVSLKALMNPLETFEPFDADVALLSAFAEKIAAASRTDPADVLRWRRNASVLEQVQSRIVKKLHT